MNPLVEQTQSTPQALSEQSRIEQAFVEATKHHRAGNINQAALIYNIILQISPQYVHALYRLGALAHQFGKVDTAIFNRETFFIPSRRVFRSSPLSFCSTIGNYISEDDKLAPSPWA